MRKRSFGQSVDFDRSPSKNIAALGDHNRSIAAANASERPKKVARLDPTYVRRAASRRLGASANGLKTPAM
jgi:hypothetical protein